MTKRRVEVYAFLYVFFFFGSKRKKKACVYKNEYVCAVLYLYNRLELFPTYLV